MAAKKADPETDPIPVDEADGPQAKAQRRARQPLVATDLPSAAEVLRRAQNRAQRAEKAYQTANEERTAAVNAVKDAKADMERFYAELMGTSQDATDAP